MELHDGDIIIFNNSLTHELLNSSYNLNFRVIDYNLNVVYYQIRFHSYYMAYISIVGGSDQYDNVYNYDNNRFEDARFNKIEIVGDQTITDEEFINWLYENTVSGLPPRVMENMYAVVGDQIQYSFSNIGDVLGSIVNNGVLTIFTLGIFIVSLAVGLLRRISRRKNFK